MCKVLFSFKYFAKHKLFSEKKFQLPLLKWPYTKDRLKAIRIPINWKLINEKFIFKTISPLAFVLTPSHLKNGYQ